MVPDPSASSAAVSFASASSALHRSPANHSAARAGTSMHSILSHSRTLCAASAMHLRERTGSDGMNGLQHAHTRPCTPQEIAAAVACMQGMRVMTDRGRGGAEAHLHFWWRASMRAAFWSFIVSLCLRSAAVSGLSLKAM